MDERITAASFGAKNPEDERDRATILSARADWIEHPVKVELLFLLPGALFTALLQIACPGEPAEIFRDGTALGVAFCALNFHAWRLVLGRALAVAPPYRGRARRRLETLYIAGLKIGALCALVGAGLKYGEPLAAPLLLGITVYLFLGSFVLWVARRLSVSHFI